MAVPLPRFSVDSIVDYMALAIGLSVGFAILREPAKAVEQAISKR
jgi:hypothetical protein